MVAIGCDNPEPAAKTNPPPVATDSATVSLIGQNLAENLLAYTQRLESDSVPLERLRERLPMHARMLKDVLMQYEREMIVLDVNGSGRWRAILDSLRTDLWTLGQTPDGELRDALRAHQRRVRALITAHESMLPPTNQRP